MIGVGAIIHSIDVDPVDQSVYVATVFGDGIWKSSDFGDTFTRIDRAPDAPPGVFLDLSGRGIMVDPQNHNNVFFADRASGTWRSQDAGASWINVDPTPAQNVTVDPTDSNSVYVGSLFSGVLKSTDGGASFTVKSNGLPEGVRMPPAGGVRVTPPIPTSSTWSGGRRRVQEHRRCRDLDAHQSGTRWRERVRSRPRPVRPNVLYSATSSSVYKTGTGGQ